MVVRFQQPTASQRSSQPINSMENPTSTAITLYNTTSTMLYGSNSIKK